MPVTRTAESEEALVAAARLAAERRATVAIVHVLEVPMELPLDAALHRAGGSCGRSARRSAGAGGGYGVRAVTRLVRARRAGPAIVEDAVSRDAELVVIGAPRAHGPPRTDLRQDRRSRPEGSPSRVLMAAGRSAA